MAAPIPSNHLPISSLRKLSWRENLFIFSAAVVVTGLVYKVAWLSEDCFITLRYVANTLSGYGPVFNVGERVQGYTHPLWFVLLLIGSLIFRNPISVAYGFSFLLTFLTVAFVGRALLQRSPGFLAGALLLGITGLAWCMSDPWLSFQTGGLENPLAHLLIVAIVWETWAWAASRPGRLMLLLGLLCLTRPDYLVLVAPLAGVLLMRVRSVAQIAVLGLALAPVIAWLLFALFYYHDIFPNTFYAKVGIYSSLGAAIAQGLGYLGDWFTYDVLAAGSTFVFLLLAAWRSRTWERIALCLGIVLYLGWTVQVGGDFMRGRLFVSVLTASMFAGSLALAEQLHAPSLRLDLELTAVGIALSGLFIAWLAISEPPLDLSQLSIVNERKFYPGYSLEFLLENGELECPIGDLHIANIVRNYAEKCGPVTLHMYSPGTFGYLAGPKVYVIDALGLTDAYIAHLPREALAKTDPRPGHPIKRIPLKYLMSRKDIVLLPHWFDIVKRGDCDLDSQFEKLKPPGDRTLLP